MFELAPQQQEAFEDIEKWYNGPDQVYYLAGWAGTGKTSLARVLAQRLADFDEVIFAAYTGKAAFRLRECGCPSASTIHSYIYHSRESSREALVAYKKELDGLIASLQAEKVDPTYISAHPKVQQLEGLIYQEEQNSRRPIFKLNPLSPVKDAPLTVLDEVSMVDEKIKTDWCSFKTKVLVLGDPFQLPPVGGEGAFTKRKPNYMLTKIHRQAEGNPIIQLASQIRQMQMPKCGIYGNARIVRKSDLSKSELRDIVLRSDQVIVGKNDTRHEYNNRMRMLKGFKERYPMAGETLVCLRNNHELGLLNGALYEVVKRLEVFDDLDRVSLRVRPQGGGPEIDVDVHTHHFLGKEDLLKKMWFTKSEAEEFDYGYALTCHKAQGSQFKNPVIFDQSYIARQYRWNWLYTAFTRAIDGLTLVLG